MINKFLQYIESNSLVISGDKVLVAVSGGIDSGVMAHLFRLLGNNFDLAHCNFHLRDSESDGDQLFVEEMALRLSCKCFVRHFDTKEFADSQKISIQMAARDLRYQWFSQVANKEGYSKIAIAHNRDDLVETFLINLSRGTGIKGLTGIKAKSGNIIRPLLFATRSEIEDFAQKEQITFREDSSNKETKYQRNLIRHSIIPLFKQINPSFTDTILQETEIFRMVNMLYKSQLEQIRNGITIQSKPELVLSITKMKELDVSPALLFDLLEEYNFSFETLQQLIISLNGQSGKTFFSSQYECLKDRDIIIIRRKELISDNAKYWINKEAQNISYPISLTFTEAENSPNYQLEKSSKFATLDLEKLQYPLEIRKWQSGDYFYPIGMQGKMKLSDFFVNQKINRFEKDAIWILTSDNEIVWVIGYRIDNRYKIDNTTHRILQISINN